MDDLDLPAGSLGPASPADAPEIGAKAYSSDTELLRWRIFVSVGLFIPFAALVIALVRLWMVGPVLSDFVSFGAMFILTEIGVAAGYHRLFSHRSFVAARWLHLTLAVLGSMSLIGPVAIWVATHRRHHARSDKEGDPHSPHWPYDDASRSFVAQLRILVRAHVGWLYTPDYSPLERWAPDVLADPAMMAINRRFTEIAAVSVFGPALVVFAVTRSPSAFWGALLWGGFVRIGALMHLIFAFNWLCHYLGNQPFKTRDRSTNLWPLAILTLGESWHNNHHAWPSSAIASVSWWQVDLCGMLIRALELCGAARDVKRPSRESIARKRADAATNVC